MAWWQRRRDLNSQPARMRDKDRAASFQLPKSYSVKKNVGGVPQQTRRLSRLNIAQWRCGDQLGETVKSRVSHQPPGFAWEKNTGYSIPRPTPNARMGVRFRVSHLFGQLPI